MSFLRSVQRILLLSALAGVIAFTGTACSPGEGTDGANGRTNVQESPTSTPETSPEAFAEFSGVTLPEDLEILDIEADNDDRGSPVYRVVFTGTWGDADQTCEQVGNYRIQSGGVPEDLVTGLGIPAQDLADAQDPAWGCGAVLQSTGADIDAVVLHMDDEAAKVYLSAEAFRT